MPTTVKMETAAYHDIPNEQTFVQMPPVQAQKLRAEFESKFPTNIPLTNIPTEIYNCHGLVFGSRRTQIDGKAIRPILKDDQYKKIAKENAQVGDIVLFVAPNGDIEHSAIVIEPPTAGTAWLPRVLGKWGPFTEYFHYANLSEYDTSNLEYWRVEWPQTLIV